MQGLEAAYQEANLILDRLKRRNIETTPSLPPVNRPQDDIKLNQDTALNHANSFCIFTKLEELYNEEFKTEHKNQKASNSFLLEKLVLRFALNTLVLNLYPEKNEYSFSLRNEACELSKSGEEISPSLKMVWLPDDDLLRYIDNEELPCILTDILEQEHQELFYSGCIILEIREYQQSGSTQQLCGDNRYVLLRPTVQSLWADMNLIMEKTGQDWSEQEKLELESELVLSTNPVLCLDPAPSVSIVNNIINHQKQIFNTTQLKKCAEKFTLISRKRKIEALSSNVEPSDFILRKKQRLNKNIGSKSSKVPRMNLPAPNLEIKRELSLPEKINTDKFRCFPAPRESRSCMPLLIEEYILDTDRQCERDPSKILKLHIQLSILQRPIDSEFLGELYLDVDYKAGVNNGASSRFTLGSRSYVDKFIRQFTDMLTKKGRKSMKIVKRVAGQEPKYICIPGFTEKDKSIESRGSVQQPQIQQMQSVNTVTNTVTNGSAPPNVVIVSNQNLQNTSTAVPILQAQLQTNSQTSKIEARHSTNPEINALVASFISTAQQLEQEKAAQAAAAAAAAQAAAQKQQPVTNSNNAAILSLLNTSPVNAVNSAATASLGNAITNTNQSLQLTQQQLQTKLLGRKINITNVQPRMLNHNNVVTNTAPTPQQVRISALASQLASPPVNVIIATANTSQQSQQGHAFTLTTVGGNTNFPMNYVVNRSVTNQTRNITSPVTNRKNSGENSVPGLSALLVNTPAADHPIPGANNASGLLERLTANSSNSMPDGTYQTVQGKTIQQIPVQLAAKGNQVINQQTSQQNTLNLHTLNLAPFQSHINNIPGLQNVQVQISAPLNSSSTNSIAATGLIFSVAVTTASTTCSPSAVQLTGQGAQASAANSTPVVIANSAASSVLSLPIAAAHLVASGTKGIAQQVGGQQQGASLVRAASPAQTVAITNMQQGKSVQLVNAAQLANIKNAATARGLSLHAQRITNTNAVKIAAAAANANSTQGQVSNVAVGMNISSNVAVQNKQAQYQAVIQQQQLQNFINNQQSQNQKISSVAALAAKHHRRSSAADPNK